MMKSFKTHKGDVITGEKLQAALDIVADKHIENAHAIRKEDCYASHVTEQRKDQNLKKGLALAESIRAGNETGFWCLQRLNYEITGESVPMLPK